MLHCPRSIARAIVCSGFVFATGQALAADPTGDWRVSDGVANIRVAQCYGNMWGAVSWEKIPGGRDSNNPDASKQSRPTLGMPTLINMKKKPGVDQWEGQVYNAKDGQTYSATIKPVGTDQLEIQGCVLGFLCGGETWTRVGPPIPSSPVAQPRPVALLSSLPFLLRACHVDPRVPRENLRALPDGDQTRYDDPRSTLSGSLLQQILPPYSNLRRASGRLRRAAAENWHCSAL